MQVAVILLMAITTATVHSVAIEPADSKSDSRVETPWPEQNVLFDFYFDEPEKINWALYWIRSLKDPLMDAPYNQATEFINAVSLFMEPKSSPLRIKIMFDTRLRFSECATTPSPVLNSRTEA
jgi:hypothetical protein